MATNSGHLVRRVFTNASLNVLNGLSSDNSDQTKNQKSRKNSNRNLTRSHQASGLRVSASAPDPAPW